MLAALNLVLLVVIGLAASGVRVPRSFTQMVMQSAEPRLQDVTRRIALDIERSHPDQATALLARYGGEYHTRFILVRNDGTHIAGVPLRLPDDVLRAMSGPPPRELGGPGGDFRPPPKGAFPPPPGAPRGPEGPGGFGPPDRDTGLRMPQAPPILVSVPGGPKTWIVMRTPIRFAGDAAIIPGSLIIVPYGFFGDSLLFPVRWLWWSFLAIAVTVACWFPFLRGVTTSIRRMEKATDQIAHGRFDTRVDVARADELGRLSSSIDTMAGRLGAMVTSQKRFLGDTAHELRSPLGRMQVALEILDRRTDDGGRAYIADLKEDVEDLSALTDDLLHYARTELAERGSANHTVSLGPIIERVIAKEGNGATIDVAMPPQLNVRGDAQLIERAIANVVRNAVKYAGASGPISMRTESSHDLVTLAIADAGPGVAQESLPRLFEPFFREDAARNRKTGGVGLGLAIVRSAVEACGGTVEARNRTPNGLEVRLQFKNGRP